MNVRIFRDQHEKYKCAQTRPQLKLSPDRVWGRMESETMLTPRAKIPSTRSSEEVRTRHAASIMAASPTHYRLSYSGPHSAKQCRYVVCWLVGCLTSQQQASVSQGRICSDSFTCCHTEIEVADQTFYLTQSQYTDTGPTSPSVDPITPGAWQGSHWSANFEVPGMTRPRKNPGASGIRTRDLPLSRRTPYH